MLIFLWFPNEVKASLSFDSGLAGICSFVKDLSKEQDNWILPFVFKIKILTFYNFDFRILQNYEIYLAWKKYSSQPSPSGFVEVTYPKFCSISMSESYTCKNEIISSFIPTFSFSISKRKEIKKFFKRVDLFFDFSMPLLYFKVALLTKDGENLKFFHVPEYRDAFEEWKRGRPFRFSFCINDIYNTFLSMCGYYKGEIKNSSDNIESVDKYFFFLYCVASCFTFCFDVRICSYLFCCIKIPIISVFELFFLFRYLFLKKECEELLVEYHKKEEGGEKNALVNLLYIKEDRRASMLIVVRKKFPLLLLSQILNFSIRF